MMNEEQLADYKRRLEDVDRVVNILRTTIEVGKLNFDYLVAVRDTSAPEDALVGSVISNEGWPGARIPSMLLLLDAITELVIRSPEQAEAAVRRFVGEVAKSIRQHDDAEKGLH